MPLTLSTLISGHANRFPSPTSRHQRKLYFPPGGHTRDRHAIPPDQLHISFSDPVLVAAEQRLSNVPNEQRRNKLSIIKDAGARKTAKLGSVMFHVTGGILSQRSGGDNDDALVAEAVSPLVTVPNPQGTRLGHYWEAGVQGTGVHLLNSSDDSGDIFDEVVTLKGATDGSPGNADSSTSQNSRCGSDLAPLASETFKEELYIRGYLKRPAPSKVVSRKSRTSFALVSRKVFPRVLGRRHGRKVAECLRARQATSLAESSGGLDARFSEKLFSTSVASVTFRTPADDLESPGMDTSTSGSESFDLHEFSYITAFTTPPSSPSIVTETFKKGVNLGDSKHAV